MGEKPGGKHMCTTGLFSVDQVTQAGVLRLSHCFIGWAYIGLQLQRSLSWELWVHTGKKEMSHEEGN